MNNDQKRDYLYQVLGNVLYKDSLPIMQELPRGDDALDIQVDCNFRFEFRRDKRKWVVSRVIPNGQFQDFEIEDPIEEADFETAVRILIDRVVDHRIQCVKDLLSTKDFYADGDELTQCNTCNCNMKVRVGIDGVCPNCYEEAESLNQHGTHVAGTSMQCNMSYGGDIPVADIDKQDPEERQEAIRKLRAAGRGSGKSRMAFKQVMQPVGEWVNDRMLQIEIVFRSHVSEMPVDQISEISKEYFKLKDWKDAVCSLDRINY